MRESRKHKTRDLYPLADPDRILVLWDTAGWRSWRYEGLSPEEFQLMCGE